MLLSTKQLSLMRLMSRGRRRPAEIVALLQSGECPLPCRFVRPAPAHQGLQEITHQLIDGDASPSRDGSRAIGQLVIQFQCEIDRHRRNPRYLSDMTLRCFVAGVKIFTAPFTCFAHAAISCKPSGARPPVTPPGAGRRP